MPPRGEGVDLRFSSPQPDINETPADTGLVHRVLCLSPAFAGTHLPTPGGWLG